MQFGVEAIAWTLVIDEIIALSFNVYPVRKYIGFDFKTHLLDALPSFTMSLIMGLLVYGEGFLIENNLLCLIVQVLTGSLVYVVLSVLTKNEAFFYLKSILLSKVRR